MDERIELNIFLGKLASVLVRKFDAIEAGMRDIRLQIETLKQGSDRNAVKMLDEKVRGLETTINSLRSKSQIDTSILRLIEAEEGQRKASA
jgi:hypothetical protein